MMNLFNLVFFVFAELLIIFFIFISALRLNHGWIREIIPIVIVAFILRLLLFFLLNVFWTPDFQPDSERYDLGALHFTRGLRDNHFVSIQEMIDTVGTKNGIFYMYLLGVIYFLADTESSIAVNLNNCLIGALTLIPLYALAYGVSKNRLTARIAAWIYALLPIASYWSVHNLKESFDVLIYVSAIAIFLLPRNRLAFVVGLSLLFVLYFERSYIVYLISISFILSWYSMNSRKKPIKSLLFFSGLLISMFYFASQQVLDQIVALLEMRNQLLNKDSILSSLKTEIPIYVVWIIDFFHLAITPLPISPPPGWDSFLSIGIIFWYVLLPFVIVGFYKMYKLNTFTARCIVIFAIFGFMLFAFMYSGSHYRGRDSLLPIAAIAAAFTVSRHQKNGCVSINYSTNSSNNVSSKVF